MVNRQAVLLSTILLAMATQAAAQNGSATVMGDFDGDGHPDMAVWNDTTKKWDIYLNCGKGFAPPVAWDGLPGTDGPIFAADLNGDKKTDIFMWKAADNTWSVNLSNGSGFDTASWQGMWGSDGAIHVGDLNGDGKADVFMWRAANNTWSVNLSTGKGFQAESWTGAWGSDGPINVGDLNGDGKTDVFMWRDSDKVWTVNLSTGKGFKSEIWQGAWGSDGPISVGDLNGDGKADVFMWRNSDKVWTVNLSTGKGFNAEIWQGAWGSDGPINVGDLNGDGKVDVFMWRAADGVWTVNLSSGSGFRSNIWKGNSGNGLVFVADLDGDKKKDTVIWRAGDSAWPVNLSTGQGWTPASWSSLPTPTPTITSFNVDPTPVAHGAPVLVDYTVSVPPNCTLATEMFTLDKNGGAIDPVYTVPNGQNKGQIALIGNTFPARLQLEVMCVANSACTNPVPAVSGILNVAGPPVLTIAQLEAAGDGMTAVAPNSLYVPVGTTVTLSWNVTNCSAGCNISLQGIQGTNGAAIFQRSGLPPAGSAKVAPNETITTYVLNASDSVDGAKSSKMEVQLAPPAQTCTNCQWYYFQLNSPPDAATPECFTYAVYASSLGAATAAAQAQAINYSVKQITAAQYYAGCDQ